MTLFHEDNRRPLMVAAVAVIVMLPIVFFGIPNGADLPNHLRFVQPFLDSLRSGHWHPGWLAESNDGFGDPRFRFYPPGLYYVLIVARLINGNWYAASIVTFVALSIIGAVGTYFWARGFCDSRTAMWAGMLYVVVPFHLNELYQASLLSEYAACAVLPFAFAFTERVCRERKLSDVAGLAGSFALLVLTNLPATVIGSISLAVYSLLIIERKALLQTIIRLMMAVGVSLAATSYYWITVVAELSWIKGNGSDPNPYYDYRLNFLFSPAALANRNTWYANLLALAMIAFLSPALLFAWQFLRDRQKSRRLGAAVILTVLSFLFATPLSRPAWILIPKLSEVQFPWRWLSVTSLCGSVILAASLSRFGSKVRLFRPRELAIGLCFIASLGFVIREIVVDCDYLDRVRFETMAQAVRGGESFKDWLPVSASDLAHIDPRKEKIEAGARAIVLKSWEPQTRVFHVETGVEPEARVRTFYYPHWRATANAIPLALHTASDGAILISLPTASADVTLTFQEPARVHYAELVSLFAWLGIAAVGVRHLVLRIASWSFSLTLAESR
jgi:6-pyruvoyl-tetrahydropterin synthase-like protein